METVTVTFGGKEYSATQLTFAEQCEIARIMAALKRAPEGLPTVLLLKISKIVCASIRRTGSNIPVEEVRKEWTVFAGVEVLEAVNTLLGFTVQKETSALLDDELPGSAKIQ